MKPYTKRYEIKDNSQVYGYQFTIKISTIGRLYAYEYTNMMAKIDKIADDLICYSELIEDRRSNNTIPKGYRTYRFWFTDRNNIVRKYENSRYSS